MNLGLGFAFGATVDGFKDGLRSVGSGISSFVSSVGDAVSSASDKLGTLSDALQLKQLADIKEQIGSFTGMDQDVSRLTSGFEQTRVSADEALAKIGAGLNMSGKELAKWRSTVTSAAMSTNTDVSSAAETFQRLAESQVDLAEIGIPTFQEFLKIQKATGLDVQKFAQGQAMLTKQLGLSGKQVGSLMDDFAQIAKTSNLGTESLNGMGEQLEELKPLLVGTLQRKGPEAVMRMLRSTQMLSGVMQEAFGGDTASNMAAARALTMKLAESQDQLNGVFVGMGDFPEFQTEVATNFGSMAEAQELMSTDSMTFIRRLRDMKAGLEAKSPLVAATFMERMTRQLREVDPQLAALFTGAENVTAAFDKMGDPSGPVADAEGALRRMGREGFRTGRTLSEATQFALDGFEQKLRDIKGAEIDKMFRKEIIPSINSFGNELKQISEDGGLLGMMVDKMSMFQKVGSAAFLPLDKEWGKKVFVLSQTFAPLIDQVLVFAPAMAAAVVSAASLFSTLVTGWPVISSVAGGISAIAGAFAGWPAVIAAAVAAFVALPAMIVGLGTESGGQLYEWLSGLLDTVTKWANEAAPKAIAKMEEWTQSLLALDTDQAAEDFALWLSNSMDKGLDRSGDLLTKMGGLAKIAGTVIAALGKLVAIGIGVAAEVALTYFEDEWITPFGYLLEEELVKPLSKAWDSFVEGIAWAAGKYFEIVKKNWISAFKYMLNPLQGLMDAMQAVYDLADYLFGNSVHEIIAADFSEALDLVLPSLQGIADAIQATFDFAGSVVDTFFDGIGAAFEVIKNIGSTVFGVIGKAIGKALEKIGLPVEYLTDLAGALGVDVGAASVTADAESTAAAREGKKAMIAAEASDDQMLVLIGEVRLMRNQLHGDLVKLIEKPSLTTAGRRGVAIDGRSLAAQATGGA